MGGTTTTAGWFMVGLFHGHPKSSKDIRCKWRIRSGVAPYFRRPPIVIEQWLRHSDWLVVTGDYNTMNATQFLLGIIMDYLKWDFLSTKQSSGRMTEGFWTLPNYRYANHTHIIHIQSYAYTYIYIYIYTSISIDIIVMYKQDTWCHFLFIQDLRRIPHFVGGRGCWENHPRNFNLSGETFDQLTLKLGIFDEAQPP